MKFELDFSFVNLITLIFFVLKEVGVLKWGWFWILSPTIFYIGIPISIFCFVFLMVLIFDRNNK